MARCSNLFCATAQVLSAFVGFVGVRVQGWKIGGVYLCMAQGFWGLESENFGFKVSTTIIRISTVITTTSTFSTAIIITTIVVTMIIRVWGRREDEQRKVWVTGNFKAQQPPNPENSAPNAHATNSWR